METTHHEHSHQRHGHGHGDGHGHDHGHGHDTVEHAHGEADWSDEDFVKGWLQKQEARLPERRKQFIALRAFIPKYPNQEFRYLNLGVGPGFLDEILLDSFPGANAVVLDGSFSMLGATRKTLARFGERVEYVQANLETPEWTGAVAGPFDFVISTRAIHHVGDAARIAALYGEIRALTGHGGTFLNLDYVRPARAELARLSKWITKDPEAGFAEPPHGVASLPGTLQEHLGWLTDAGFGCVEVYWKQMDLALMCGINGHLHMPWGHGDEPETAQTEGQAHGHGEGHAS